MAAASHLHHVSAGQLRSEASALDRVVKRRSALLLGLPPRLRERRVCLLTCGSAAGTGAKREVAGTWRNRRLSKQLISLSLFFFFHVSCLRLGDSSPNSTVRKLFSFISGFCRLSALTEVWTAGPAAFA